MDAYQIDKNILILFFFFIDVCLCSLCPKSMYVCVPISNPPIIGHVMNVFGRILSAIAMLCFAISIGVFLPIQPRVTLYLSFNLIFGFVKCLCSALPSRYLCSFGSGKKIPWSVCLGNDDFFFVIDSMDLCTFTFSVCSISLLFVFFYFSRKTITALPLLAMANVISHLDLISLHMFIKFLDSQCVLLSNPKSPMIWW